MFAMSKVMISSNWWVRGLKRFSSNCISCFAHTLTDSHTPMVMEFFPNKEKQKDAATNVGHWVLVNSSAEYSLEQLLVTLFISKGQWGARRSFLTLPCLVDWDYDNFQPSKKLKGPIRNTVFFRVCICLIYFVGKEYLKQKKLERTTAQYLPCPKTHKSNILSTTALERDSCSSLFSRLFF